MFTAGSPDPARTSYRQRLLFVEHYLGESSGSVIDAVRRARYQWPEKLRPRLVEKSRVQAAINARVATAAMAANEVLARVADVASSDLLDFIQATGRDCSLSTTSVDRRGPPSMPGEGKREGKRDVTE